ncbi:Morn repeat domain containing protein [Pandoravirus salinus]|uniref:Morn repeat domain containing protein n=1 Tax=Pandoravirus salinus TaxID=1349410 RepID=S4W5W9_9VIRU|nr:morn repeat domain [Pandoravirus salinus]AGO85800.1 Morn repeat domain containing protein [Pandoravirus salinus]
MENVTKIQANTEKESKGCRAAAEGRHAVACILDSLPDEVMLDVLVALGSSDVRALLAWSATCRRHRALAMDSTLWRCLYRRRFGAPLHERFLDEGKDWLWLYRARACTVPLTSVGHAVGGQNVATPADAVFWGDFVDGNPCGYGLHANVALGPDRIPIGTGAAAVAPSAAVRHEGHWHGGHMNGKAFAVRTDGSRYQGDWVDGKYHGYGVLTDADGRVFYRGQWQRGSACGYGVRSYDGCDHYAGEWEHGLPNGCGIRTNAKPDGSDSTITYRGMFRDGAYTGYGVVQYSHGGRYEGEWQDGRAHGFGTYTSADAKETYCGHWKHGTYDGFGVIVYKKGHRYEGEWRDGERHGHGTYTCVDGWRVHGTFEYGMQRGYAERVEPDGRVYRGECRDGLPHGRGALCDPDGTVHEGLFRHGQSCDARPDVYQVVRSWPNGFRYEGGWHDSRGSTGHGVCDYPDGSRITGTWNGPTPVDGTVDRHGPSCDAGSPCTACGILAKAPRQLLP